jgi:hypothetical protein
MLAVGNRRGTGLIEERGKDSFPVDQRRRPDVEAVEIEEIEGVVDEAVLPTRFEVGLQRSEVAGPGPGLNDHLAIEDDLVDRQPRNGCGNAGEVWLVQSYPLLE